MKKGDIMFFDRIEQFCDSYGFELSEHGTSDCIGENVVIIRKDEGYGLVATFVLISLAQYELVYIDFNSDKL